MCRARRGAVWVQAAVALRHALHRPFQRLHAREQVVQCHRARRVSVRVRCGCPAVAVDAIVFDLEPGHGFDPAAGAVNGTCDRAGRTAAIAVGSGQGTGCSGAERAVWCHRDTPWWCDRPVAVAQALPPVARVGRASQGLSLSSSSWYTDPACRTTCGTAWHSPRGERAGRGREGTETGCRWAAALTRIAGRAGTGSRS